MGDILRAVLCTHVYTTVYTRVHNIALSISSVGLSQALHSGLTPSHSKPYSWDTIGMEIIFPKELERGASGRSA